MTSTDITYACGHSTVMNLTGPRQGRETAAWRESKRSCDDCFAREREETRLASKAAAESRGLADLEGSPKQIAWALTIREKAITFWADGGPMLATKLIDGRNVRVPGEPMDDSWKPVLTSIVDTLSSVTSAKWWIDARDRIHTHDPVEVIGYLATGMPFPDRDDIDAAWLAVMTELYPGNPVLETKLALAGSCLGERRFYRPMDATPTSATQAEEGQ